MTVISASDSLEHHLSSPRGLGALARAPHTGAAGGAACGDLVRVSVRVSGDRIAEAGFEASGCAAARAAGSAVVELAEGAPVLAAARIGPTEVTAELGGLSPSARHAAELAADAFHRALGLAARDGEISLAPSPARTLVAMSGGVDSAAAAQLALDGGEDVVAVTLELWSDPGTDGERSCCSPQAVTGARALAHSIGLPHLTLDLRDRFRTAVVDDFIDGRAAGVTPNPCVRCNGLVRFADMLALARDLGAARLATGHYARIEDDGAGPLVAAAADPRKDQSYVLCRLDGADLDRLRFPLGNIEKPAVRALARRAGLPVADKPESQDLCFLAGTSGPEFMRRHGPEPAGTGEIVDDAGHVLGSHRGHEHFTVGQRRGLGVAAAEPLYVVAKDARRNRVVAGPRSRLLTRRVGVGAGALHRDATRTSTVRLRYHAPQLTATVAMPLARGPHDGFALDLDTPALAPAPGQIACLYDRAGRVVGWGQIGTGPR